MNKNFRTQNYNLLKNIEKKVPKKKNIKYFQKNVYSEIF